MVDAVYTKITIYAIKLYLPNELHYKCRRGQDKDEAKMVVEKNSSFEVVRLGLIRVAHATSNSKWH